VSECGVVTYRKEEGTRDGGREGGEVYRYTADGRKDGWFVAHITSWA